MKHKMVNLCQTSFELAGKKPNFSKWVREQLLKDQKLEERTYEYECESCSGITTSKKKRRVMLNDCCNVLSRICGVKE